MSPGQYPGDVTWVNGQQAVLSPTQAGYITPPNEYSYPASSRMSRMPSEALSQFPGAYTDHQVRSHACLQLPNLQRRVSAVAYRA